MASATTQLSVKADLILLVLGDLTKTRRFWKVIKLIIKIM